MKSIILTVSAIVILTLTPRPVHALGDTEAAILGGVLGGAIIGFAINEALDHDYDYVEVGYQHGHRSGRDYGHSRHGPSCGCHSCRPSRSIRHHDYDRDYDRHDRGHWTYRTVKVWIPQRTWFVYDDCGRRTKHYRRGYWTHRQEKVWVQRRGRW